MAENDINWKEKGVRVVRRADVNLSSPTPWAGVNMAAAVTQASTYARKIWAGMIEIQPAARTGPHHHGELESVIYVVEGLAGMRWGDRLEYYVEASPGDFIFVPPFVPHQELNASTTQRLVCVLVRSDQKPVVVQLEIPDAVAPEIVAWVDPHHPKG